MQESNTSGRKSAGNLKQRNNFSCFAVCTIRGTYTHTYQQTSSKHASSRKNKQQTISLIYKLPIGLPMCLQTDSNLANVGKWFINHNEPSQQVGPLYLEAGRPPECSFLLIFEIEISQVITNFHHHIKTWNLTILNALFPKVNLFHLNQLAFII